MLRRPAVVVPTPVVAALAASASAQPATPSLIETSRQLLRDLVAIDTSQTTGSTTPAAERVARELKAAGLKVTKGNAKVAKTNAKVWKTTMTSWAGPPRRVWSPRGTHAPMPP